MYRNIKKKQIILVRHAKAVEREDWKGDDMCRPIIPEGENSNQIVANYLRLIGLKPDRIVSSPSARTRSTAEGLGQKLGIEKIEYVHNLYNEGCSVTRDPMQVHLDVVHKNKKTGQTLMIVGHNDDLTNFAKYLSGDDVPSMKKGSVVVLSLPENLEWKDVRPNSLKFVYYLTPQFLRLEELI